MRGCVGEPISWLRLERYALDELPAGERAAVSGHLEACDACAQCLDRVRADADRALPSLPAAVRAVAGRERRARRLWTWGAVAAAAAAILLAVLLVRSGPRAEDGGAIPAPRVAIKGGELALEVVRMRGRTAAYEPRDFEAEDRFKVLVTCPAPAPVHADAVVFQDGDASFPLPAEQIHCGNRIGLSGAFRITGSGTAIVCVIVDADAPPDRARIARVGAAGLRDAACVSLEPLR